MEDELTENIIKVLKKHDKLATEEVEKLAGKNKEGCSDRISQRLLTLKNQGKVDAEFSKEKKSYVWWLK